MRDHAPTLRRVGFLLLGLVAILSGSTAWGIPDPAPHPPSWVSNEILIKFREGTSLAAPDSIRALVGARRLAVFRNGAEHWRTAPDVTTEQAMARLQGLPQVEVVEPNWIVKVSAAPDDPFYPQLWGLKNTGQGGGTPGADIDAQDAWDIQTGSRNVVVGVIDTGIDMTHPDLAPNIWTNPGEIPGNLVDDDQNGYVDDVHGWDFCNHDADPYDDHGHGTHVAGTIGATGNNGVGVAGVSWEVSLAALKFICAEGSGTTAGAIGAVEYATSMRFDMTNNSWGGGGYSQVLRDAIRAADSANVLFVAAAGNDGVNSDSYPAYPAGYDAPNIIAVAATDPMDRLASFSNYGSTTVDLGAPGVDILSSVPGARYESHQGTSMAAPHVTGVAALLRAASPGAPNTLVKRALMESADPVPALSGLTVTGGRLNAKQALRSLDLVPPDGITDLTASIPTSSSVTLEWTAPGDDGSMGTAAGYDIRYATFVLDEATFETATRASDSPHPSEAGSTETMEVMGLQPDTGYHFAVRAMDEAGNHGPISNVVMATTLPPPVFHLEPAGVSAALRTGQMAAIPVTIGNAGDGTLDWRMVSGPAWASASPSAGRVWSGQSQEVAIRLDATGRGGGTYTGLVSIASNDPARPQAELPVSLEVTDAPAVVVGPAFIDFGTLFAGFSATRMLTVASTGTLDLTGTLRSSDPAVALDVTSFHTPPGGSVTAAVTVSAGAPGRFTANVVIESDAANAPIVTVPISAEVLPPPGVSVDPPSIEEHLFTGGSLDRIVHVINTGESDLLIGAFATLSPPGAGVEVRLESSIVPPGASRDLVVTLHAFRSETAAYAGEVQLSTNIPDRAVVRLPVTLQVTAAPDIALTGNPVSLLSSQHYTGNRATTQHNLTVSMPPGGDGTVQLVADGDYGSPTETATVYLEGAFVGYASGNSLGDCTPVQKDLLVDAWRLSQAAADGVVSIEVRNSSDVDSFCSLNRHTVRLSYPVTVNGLNFGDVFAGTPHTLGVTVTNPGHQVLEVVSITSDQPEFAASPGSLTLAPGGSRSIDITFVPQRAGLHQGTITFFSNDPDEPSISLPVAGRSLEPPVVALSPPSLSAALTTGERAVRTLTVSNTGGTVLEFRALVRQAVPAQMQDVPFAGFSGPAMAGVDGSYLGIPGDFDSLAQSPAPLTCMVEDPAAGVLYGQANSGRAFYRYVAADNRWETLATSPLDSGDNGGAALLNGKIYTLYTGNESQMGVYDIASDSWSVVPHPMAAGTALITSDGDRFLYVVASGFLARFDPSTATATLLANPPFGNSGWGGLRWLSGSLYMHQGGGRLGFATYDVAANAWTELPPLPFAPLVGSAVDPIAGDYYAYGGWLGETLCRYSIANRLWSVATIPLFRLGDGGMGWLPSPVPGVYFAQGEYGRGFARFITQPNYLDVSPDHGTVAPGASLDLTISFDASGLHGGDYAAEIHILSNDPFTSDAAVPAPLRVTGVPILELQQREEASSIRSYPFGGGTTTHEMKLQIPAIGEEGLLEVTLDGDYGFPGETATVSVEGVVLGSLGGTSSQDCTATLKTFTIPPELLAAVTSDGLVTVEVRNSGTVDANCAVNQHRVRIWHDIPGDPLDFGSVYVGGVRTIAPAIANRGTDVLHVTRISSSDPRFTVDGAPFDLYPGTARRIPVTFTPATPASWEAALSIESNDPVRPLFMVTLRGSGVEAPVLTVDPASFHEVLQSGQIVSKTITVSNLGGSDLTFDAQAIDGDQTGVVEVPFRGLSQEGDSGSGHPEPEDTSGLIRPAAGLEGYTGVTARFVRLAPSPVPLTGIVEDRSAGQLYGQESHGTGFYRYTPATDSWERLADSPLSSGEGAGAALVNGKIYVACSTEGTLRVYDMAGNSWTTQPGPGIGATGAITSDGSALYMARDYTYVRYDIASHTIEHLQLSPIRMTPWGSLRYLNGVLWAHQGSGFTGFASYDRSTYSWRTRPPVPGGAVMGAAIDPHARAYYAYGPYGGSNLYRYSIDTDSWSVATIPFFPVSDGGMGWLPSLGLFFVEGGGNGLARHLTDSPFLTVSPAAGTIPASESVELLVSVDTVGLLGATYTGRIEIASNDPVRPLKGIPVIVEVAGVPDIVVEGEGATVSSQASFNSYEAATVHALPIHSTPVGSGELQIGLAGEFGHVDGATVFAEGKEVGVLHGDSYTLCTTTRQTFILPPERMLELAADGVVEIRVQNDRFVGYSCETNQHSVALTWSGPGNRLDFGPLFVGGSRELRFAITNAGSGTLHVSRVLTSLADYVAIPSSFDLPVGSTRTISVMFVPREPGSRAAALTIESDDPDTPRYQVDLVGQGIDPPLMSIAPAFVEQVLSHGQSLDRSLTISNDGGAPLSVSLRMEGATVPGPASVPWTFQFLGPSPARLTGIVGDPATGLLYGIGVPGMGVFRFAPQTNAWQQIGTIPFYLDWNLGTALLNGKIYATSNYSNTMGVYDIASNTWSIRGTPSQVYTTHIASDGTHYLYLISPYSFVRLDPESGATVQLPLPPFQVYSGGGAGYLSGKLYVYSAYQSGFGVFDVARNTWTLLPTIPGVQALLGAATDPVGRDFYVLSGQSLHRYSIESGSWTAFVNPYFSASNGGLTWLPAPIPAVYFVQGEVGTGMARLVTGHNFVDLGAVPATIAPHTAESVNLHFESGSLPAGTYTASIVGSSNDPLSPVINVPVSMHIVEYPRLVVSGAHFAGELSQPFNAGQTVTHHFLPAVGIPAVDGAIDLVAMGDFESPDEWAALYVAGSYLGSASGNGGGCGPVSRSFDISSQVMAGLIAAHVIRFDVQNSAEVDPTACEANRHTVRLRYATRADLLDFGPRFTGSTTSIFLSLFNPGSNTLHLHSIETDRMEFAPSSASMELAPGATALLEISFSPPAAGEYAGVLTFDSDDPDHPNIIIPMEGSASAPPVSSVEPGSLHSALNYGDLETRTLSLSNVGEAPLHFMTATLTPPQAQFLSVSPETGTVPPGGSATLTVVIDTRTSFIGTHDGSILIGTDDPFHELITIPARLEIVGVPIIRITGEQHQIRSSMTFLPLPGESNHTLVLPAPPGGNGTLELTARGNFNSFGRTASTFVEGVPLGSIRGPGGDACVTANGSFVIPGTRLHSFAGDGALQVAVRNAMEVATYCPPNTHELTLTYRSPLTSVGFGEVMLGSQVTRSFFIENIGNDTLLVSRIVTDSATLSVSPSSLSIPAGKSAEILVTFRPDALGAFSGTVVMENNDASTPWPSVSVSALGVTPPMLVASPMAFTARLRPPAREELSLALSNGGGFPLSFTAAVGAPEFVTVTPSSGVVPPSGTLHLSIVIDSSSVMRGPHETTIHLVTNDPSSPSLPIPVALYVLGDPALRIQGPPVTLRRSRNFTTAGAQTIHRFVLSPPPASGADVAVIAEGEFGAADETAVVSIEGLKEMNVGGVGGGCAVAGGVVSLSKEDMDTVFADLAVNVTVRNSAQVGVSCGANRHTVDLTYRPLAETIDFAGTMERASREVTLLLENPGTDMLHVSSLSCDTPEFQVDGGPFEVPIGGTQEVKLRFGPTSVGEFYGTLLIESDDPQQPQTLIYLAGEGLPAPVLEVSTGPMEWSLLVGQDDTGSLSISNRGAADLEWSLEAPEAAAFLTFFPSSGVVPPGGSQTVSIHITTAGLPTGQHGATLEIRSNDPSSPLVTLGASLSVGGMPRIIVDRPSVEFGRVFPGYAVAGTVTIQNAGGARLEITSIAANRSEFTATPGSASIEPGASAEIALMVTATAAGSLTGQLNILSNDPEAPLVILSLTAMAVLPPVAQLSPVSLVAALPPGATTVRTLRVENTGSSELTWALGGIGGPLPSWISAQPASGAVPAAGSAEIKLILTSDSLSDGDHHQTLRLSSNDPLHGQVDATVLLHTGEAAIERLVIEPATLNPAANGNTVKVSLQLPAPLDPHEVDPATVRLNGTLCPLLDRTTFADENGDGRLELILKFDRSAFQALVPDGQSVTIVVTGEVRDRTWFRGAGIIRVIRPKITHPDGGNYVLRGQTLVISWLQPPVAGAMSYALLLSRDGGETWESLASSLSGTSFTWTADGAVTSRGRIRVLASDAQGVLGSDDSNDDFTIAEALGPPAGVSTLQVTLDESGAVALSWQPPGADVAHGPPDGYRVLRATKADGLLTELGRTPVTAWTDTTSEAMPLVFYTIVSVNASGESVE